MEPRMPCQGCGIDLTEVREMELKIFLGRMAVTCPVCGFISLVVFDSEMNLLTTGSLKSKG